MSLAADELSDRIRDLLGLHPAMSERKMFGGRCFMLHGNMLVCPTREGSLLVRVGKQAYGDALARPGALPVSMGTRNMAGFVEVAGDVLEDDAVLTDWIGRARAFVDTLPPK